MSAEKTAGEGRWPVSIPTTPGHKDGLPEMDPEGLESWAINFIRRHASEERQMVLSEDGKVLEAFPYYARVEQGENYLLTTWDTQFVVPRHAPAAVLDAHRIAQLAWLLRTDDPTQPMSAEDLCRFGFALGQAVATFRIRKTCNQQLSDRQPGDIASTSVAGDFKSRSDAKTQNSADE